MCNQYKKLPVCSWNVKVTADHVIQNNKKLGVLKKLDWFFRIDVKEREKKNDRGVNENREKWI